MKFWKYEGLGNDFVLTHDEVDRATAIDLCHRSLGVGADGVLVVTRDGGEPTVKVWNSDGSDAEICGNGLRCVTLHLVDVEGMATPLTLRSGAGLHRCHVVDGPSEEGRAVVHVEMGRAALSRAVVPVLGGGEHMIEERLEAGGRSFAFTAVGMGNPHAVTFDALDAEDVPRLGPLFEVHDLFPAKVNVGFARFSSGEGRIDLTVWERGAGLTGACGSGACAAAVAATVTGRIARGTPVQVVQPGGTLTITVGEGQSVQMTGPARRVFSGEL